MPTKNEMAATLSRADAVKAGVEVFNNTNEVGLRINTNNRKLFGFTRKQLPPNLPTEPKIYIFSISDYAEVVDIGPGFPKFDVKACPPGDRVGPPCVISALYFQEEAQVDKTEFNPHTGSQIADAVMKIGPGMAAAVDRRKVGWLQSSHNPPLDEEIDRAVEIYTLEAKRLLAEGNNFASGGRLTEINETHRRAATFLKQKVDWDKTVSKMVDCVACGEPIKQGAIVHAVGYCGAVQPGRWPDAISHGIKKIEDAPASVQAEMGYVPPSAQTVDNSFEPAASKRK